MASVTLDSLRQRAIPRSEISFLLWALMMDFVANRHPRALLASSQSWVTSKGGASPLPSGVPSGWGGEAWMSSSMGTSTSSSSGMFTWEEVSTGLVESSGLRENDEAKARETSLFGGGTSQFLAGGVQGHLGQEFTDLQGHADLTLCFGRGSPGGACFQGSVWTTTKG